MEELKRCPFCGGNGKIMGGKFIPEPQFDTTGEFIGIGITPDCKIMPAFIECEQCGATGKVIMDETSEKDAIELAIEAWNKRYKED